MKNLPASILSSFVARKAALLSFAAISAAVAVPCSSALAAPAAETTPAHPMSDQAAKLPVEHSFAKETSGDNKGLYTLTLKNTSAKPVKITATVDESVVSHNRPKTRTVTSPSVEPGKTWKIEALAAHDKVTLAADGFAPLQLVVP
jgi:hypothetical protein